jgi:Icc-related predicted phosphoesterase
MNIACISDTHMQHRGLDVAPCDVIIHAGDFLRTGKEIEVRDFFEWFTCLPSKYKILVAGNHDKSLQKKITKYNISLNECAFVLDNNGIILKNIHFWGIPFRSSSFLNSLQGIEDANEISDYSKIPYSTQILITHVPPIGILDQILPSENRSGSRILLDRVREVKPMYHIFGHIHESYGVNKNENTIFINASLTDHEEKLIRKPIYFEI